MGGRWDSRGSWDDADQADDDDSWDDSWSSKQGGQSSGQSSARGSAQQRPRPYQSPERSYPSQQGRQYQSGERSYPSQQGRSNSSQQRSAYPSSQSPQSSQYSQSQARPYQSYQSSYPSQQYQRYGSANRQAVGTRVQSQGQGRSKSAIVGGLLAVVALVGIVGLLFHNQILGLLRHKSPSTTSALVMPSFPDWRVAYAGQDGLLHAVSLDGQTDVSGISLSALPAGTPTSGAAASIGAASSPDGHYVIYAGSGGPVLLHLTAAQSDADASRTGATVPSALLWSPDGKNLAWLASNGAVHVTDVATLADTAESGTATLGITELLGWVDATHLAVRVTTTSTEQVGVLATTGGPIHAVVTLNKAGYGTVHFRLSPDGARLLAYNSPVAGQSFTAIFRNYDMSNGQVRKLPNALGSVGTHVSAVAWKPGTQLAALASGSEATHDLKLWLVDASADSASSIGAAYPLGWLSDGSQLIAGNANVATPGGGPYTLTAYNFSSTATPTTATLTDKAMTYPWLGLVRTA